ncbi:NYN domain-containing protein [Marinobacter sp. ATCH36]|uniref:NYN domain-containing protein n=1 Tax=Marinobacter sp. ATCH36 TaxID=2945106 RepID=UPI0032E509D7
MIVDAKDLLYPSKLDAFALVSSDSDFTKLASRLRESEIYVFGFGEKRPRGSSVVKKGLGANPGRPEVSGLQARDQQ